MKLLTAEARAGRTGTVTCLIPCHRAGRMGSVTWAFLIRIAAIRQLRTSYLMLQLLLLRRKDRSHTSVIWGNARCAGGTITGCSSRTFLTSRELYPHAVAFGG